jgi:hypothetical protein
MTETKDGMFMPVNELEVQLLAAKRGQTSPRGFITYMFASEVWTLSSIEQSGKDIDTTKLLYLSDDQQPTRLAIFSAPERSQPWQESFPSYTSLVKIKFKDILRMTDKGCGIMLNPGQAAGMSIPPDGILELRQEII